MRILHCGIYYYAYHTIMDMKEVPCLAAFLWSYEYCMWNPW